MYTAEKLQFVYNLLIIISEIILHEQIISENITKFATGLSLLAQTAVYCGCKRNDPINVHRVRLVARDLQANLRFIRSASKIEQPYAILNATAF